MEAESNIKNYRKMCAAQKDCQHCRMTSLLIMYGNLKNVDEALCHELMMKYPEKYDAEIISFLQEEAQKRYGNESDDSMDINTMIAHREDAQQIINKLAGVLPVSQVLELAKSMDSDIEEADIIAAEIQKSTYGSDANAPGREDEYVKPAHLKDKVVFWDIDGTLASYRFKGHIVEQHINPMNGYDNEVNNGIFLKRLPSKMMQRVISSSQARSNYVIGHYIYEKEKADKEQWLSKHYPKIEKAVFVPRSESKASALIKYCKDRGILLADVVYVDDEVHSLAEADKFGIECWHISSFLDYFI